MPKLGYGQCQSDPHVLHQTTVSRMGNEHWKYGGCFKNQSGMDWYLMESATKECFGKAASRASVAEGERHSVSHCVKPHMGAWAPKSIAEGLYVRDNLQTGEELTQTP